MAKLNSYIRNFLGVRRLCRKSILAQKQLGREIVNRGLAALDLGSIQHKNEDGYAGAFPSVE